MKRSIVIAIMLMGTVLVIALSTQRALPPVKLYNLRTLPFGDSFIITLEVSNRTSRTCDVVPANLEIRDGPAWRTCPHGILSMLMFGDVGPGSSEVMSCRIKGFSAGTRMRLRVRASRRRQGWRSLWTRARWRFLEGNRTVSLSPFDKSRFYCPESEIVSPGFTER